MRIGLLLLAPTTATQLPHRLPGYVTDNADALSDSDRAVMGGGGRF
jgi:hypothetical protein